MKRTLFFLFVWAVAVTNYAQRPESTQRCFTSPAIEQCLQQVTAKMSDQKLVSMFWQCFPSTLDTTVKLYGRDDTFVITGDIPALWLRDSGAQVWPYLRFCKDDPKLAELIRGLLMRQFRCILIDPYANAFNFNPNSPSPNWSADGTEMRPGVFERKYELNSLCYPLRLAHGYWQATDDTTAFRELWLKTVRTILYIMRTEQRMDGTSPYTFLRITDRMHDTQSNRGKGHPAKPCGLIASSFRASDDGTLLPFLVPDNFMAVSTLRKTAQILRSVNHEWALADSCEALAGQVEAALRKHAVVHTEKYGDIYAFEVDGFGNTLLMDDANVPSLLSLPYIADVPLTDPIYQNTRRFVLSTDNPYFFRGCAGEGIGGPHVGLGYIWPMSIILRALTSTDETEIRACLKTLKQTDDGTGFMHEAFHQDNPSDYTRPWFAWANTLFGELILRLIDQNFAGI